MNLKELIKRYPADQLPNFLASLREFINCELQLYIGDTHLRSWAEEEMRIRANEIAMELRGPPWHLSIEDLDFLCENAQDILNELNRF